MRLEELQKLLLPHLWKQDEPVSHAPLKYDPNFGFDGTRKKLGPKVTEKEMDSVNLNPECRNECAHLFIAHRNCIKSNSPFFWKCTGIKDELSQCHFERRIQDMKEFEREKRLNARERRLRSSS